MIFMTAEIKEKIPSLWSTSAVPLREKRVICKFFLPDSARAWYVIEGEYTLVRNTEIWELMTYVTSATSHGFAYLALGDLKWRVGPLEDPIERDLTVEIGTPLKLLVPKITEIWQEPEG